MGLNRTILVSAMEQKKNRQGNCFLSHNSDVFPNCEIKSCNYLVYFYLLTNQTSLKVLFPMLKCFFPILIYTALLWCQLLVCSENICLTDRERLGLCGLSVNHRQDFCYYAALRYRCQDWIRQIRYGKYGKIWKKW